MKMIKLPLSKRKLHATSGTVEFQLIMYIFSPMYNFLLFHLAIQNTCFIQVKDDISRVEEAILISSHLGFPASLMFC